MPDIYSSMDKSNTHMMVIIPKEHTQLVLICVKFRNRKKKRETPLYVLKKDTHIVKQQRK